MFKKLKEKIELEKEDNSERGHSPLRTLPGLAIRKESNNGEEKIEKEREEEIDEHIIDDDDVIIDDQEKEEPSSENISREQSILNQLTSELVTLRRQHNQLVITKQQNDKELNEQVQTLQVTLKEKEELVSKLERKVTELSWSVDSLTSRLQIYNDYEKEGVIKKLQSQVTELEGRLRQRDLDIEIYETRVAAQSKQRHDEQMSYKKKTHGLEDTMSSLQASVNEKDQRLAHLNGEVIKIRSSLNDVEKRRIELEEMIKEQKVNLTEKDQQMEEQSTTHGEEIERLKEEHLKIVQELNGEIEQVKKELKDKEDKLERLVTQLPNEPVVNTVLEGYSKTNMACNFEVSLHTPGGVYRKEVEPLLRPDPNAPPILPLEETTPPTSEFNPQYEVQLLESKRYNEMLEEELEEKNKTIRLQQQKLADMKKALVNKEKEAPPPPAPPISLAPPINDIQLPLENHDKRFVISSDINFQYLKNVIIRFICTREDEALQLVRAVSTLLELNSAEEKYIRDYLLYKLSWFGTMPLPPPNSKGRTK